MSLNKFKYIFAFRNVSANKKSSLVIILTLSLVFCLLILLLGMNNTFKDIYEMQAVNEYIETDIVINYDEYSEARLINKRNLEEEYEEYFDNALSFFNLNLLTETNNEKYYTSLFSSFDYEFERLIDKDVEISDNEVIITDFYSKEYNLEIGDSFTFYIFEKEFNYSVGDIFEATGVFNNLSFYAKKESILYGLYETQALNNFGNTIYLDVSDDYHISDVVEILKNDDEYSLYHIFPTVDWEYINSKAVDLGSIFLGIGLIVLLAIIMVLDSLFPIVNRNLRQNLGVVNTLGGDSKFIYHVYLIQWLMYVLISLIIGIVLSLIVTNYGIYVYGFSGFILISIVPILLSLLLVMLFVVARSFIAFRKESQITIASQSKDKRFNIYKTRYPLIIVFTLLLALEWYFHFFSLGWHSLIIVICSIYITFSLASLLLVFLAKMIEKTKKNSMFRLFQVKYLIKNKHIHQSLRVLLISLISIVLIFSVRSYLNKEIDGFYDIITFDLAITNINNYSDDLLEDISGYDITNSDEAILYSNITIHFNDEKYQPAKFFVSMDVEGYTNYFNMGINEFDDKYVSETVPYVLLPKNFKLVYDLSLGDTITLNLNYLLEDIEVVVAGYLDTNLDNFVYSNIYEIDQYQSLAKINTVFIETDEVLDSYNGLIQDYSDRMYYIINPDIYFNEMVEGVENITNYFSVFTAFMILCFVIVIFNNTLLCFFDIKSDLIKIKVLGASKKDFLVTLLKELILIFVIVLIVGIIEIYILSSHLRGVVLLIEYYKDISATIPSIIYGFVISGLVLILSYLYYWNQINKVKIIEGIKFY